MVLQNQFPGTLVVECFFILFYTFLYIFYLSHKVSNTVKECKIYIKCFGKFKLDILKVSQYIDEENQKENIIKVLEIEDSKGKNVKKW